MHGGTLIEQGRANAILSEIQEAVAGWPEIAAATGIAPEKAEGIAKSRRLALPSG